ncbi:MAG TPA: extracellular solute-binding protein [Rubrobacter sp.]|nr:extracellular solute-binding protein [Rubrobacter sp.]
MRRTRRAVSRKDFLRLGGAGLAGAALLGSGTLAGCGGGSQGGSETVKFYTSTAETTSQEKTYIEIQVDGFNEQYPKYTLEREAIPGDDLRTTLKTRLQGDEPPDVFTYGTGPGFGGVLADVGLLKSLEGAYKQNDWTVFDWAKQRATYGGTVYGVPIQVEEIVVYYNKGLVPEAPKTVEDLRAIADDLKGQGKTPLGFGDQEQWPAGHIFSIGVSNVLGRKGLDEILYGDGRWDTPEVVEAVDLLFRDFVGSGYYPEGVNAITYDDANALFYSGEAAMLPTGTWLVPTIAETVQDFEVGFFAFPSISGSGIAPPAGLGDALFVSKDAANPEGAIKFIDYLLQEDTVKQSLEKFNTIPAQPVETDGLDVPELFKSVLDDLSKSTEEGSFGYNIDVLTPPNFNEVMFTGFQEVLSGSRTPKEQVAALQAAWEKAKRQGNIAKPE